MKQKLIVFGLVAAAFAIVACVIADPPAELPTPPIQHPVILRNSVVPSANDWLITLPPEFIVPVEMGDPRDPNLKFEWNLYVDYESSAVGSATGRPPAALSGTITGGPSQPNVSWVTVPFGADQVGSAITQRRCHRIEFIVTNPAQGLFFSDSVTWFYAPLGPEGCAAFDAGLPDAAADTGPDASDDAALDGGVD